MLFSARKMLAYNATTLLELKYDLYLEIAKDTHKKEPFRHDE